MSRKTMALAVLSFLYFNFADLTVQANELSPREEKELSSIIQEKDASNLAQFLKDTDPNFSKRYDKGDKFLAQALKKCDLKKFELIEKQKASVGELTWEVILNEGCSGMVPNIYDKTENKKEIFQFGEINRYMLNRFADKLVESDKKHVNGEQIDEGKMKDSASVFSKLVEISKSKCVKNDKKHEDCIVFSNLGYAAKFMAHEGEKAESIRDSSEAEDARLESPDGLTEQACELNSNIIQNKKIIEEQKKIGKVSGFVNPTAMHEAGRKIVSLEESLKTIKAKYKAKTKKELSLSKCID